MKEQKPLAINLDEFAEKYVKPAMRKLYWQMRRDARKSRKIQAQNRLN